MNMQVLQPRVREVGAVEEAVLLVYLSAFRANNQTAPGSGYNLGVLLDRRTEEIYGIRSNLRIS